MNNISISLSSLRPQRGHWENRVSHGQHVEPLFELITRALRFSPSAVVALCYGNGGSRAQCREKVALLSNCLAKVAIETQRKPLKSYSTYFIFTNKCFRFCCAFCVPFPRLQRMPARACEVSSRRRTSF